MSDNIEHNDGWLWMPVRTKPRQEKKLAAYCKIHNIGCYLPLLRRMHHYEKSNAEFKLPMFPGYIFCQINNDTYSTIVRSNTVLFKIDLDETGEAQLIKELLSIRQLETLAMENKLIIKPELEPGTPVTIKSGPFRDIEGIVSFRNNRCRITINIEMLGQSVSTEVNIENVDKN
ncbi:MAG: hypothetical protein L3J71_04775 [Victivallaceae bacterium]|nr:hypothetical protein [Victivallaceae bacterium]